MLAGRAWPLRPALRTFGHALISFRAVQLITPAQTEIVKRFAIARVGVPEGKALDGVAEMRFGRRKFAAAKVPASQRIIAPRIQRVAAQGLAPVERGAAGGVAVLLQMQSRKVK